MMPVVKMPDGTFVDMPNDMSAHDLANFRLKTESPKERPTSLEGVASEAGKGAARGLMGVTRAIGNGLQPPEGATIGGQPARMQQIPELVNLNQQFDSLMGRNPNASPGEQMAGTIGEMGGGAMFPGGGGGLFGKAGALTDALGPRAGQYALPKLFEYTSGAQQQGPAQLSALHEFLANQTGNVAGTLLGGGTLGRLAGRFGAKALVRALTRGGKDEAAAVPIPSYPPSPLPPDVMQRIMMGTSAPLFTQGQQ